VKRHEADKILASVAQQHLKAKDATIGEKTAAWIVNKAMVSKLAIGASLNNRKKVFTRKRKSKSRKALSRKGRSTRKAVQSKRRRSSALCGAGFCVNSKTTQKKRNHLIKRYNGGNLGDKMSVKSTFHSAVRAAKSVALIHKLKNLKQIAHKSFC
jgi:hypothetical protein